ncbi:MAG: extracellular solute-binding protein [Bullifex sp.]|nr:extracellular solute-binding protein [Bullifex sp.]
MKKAIALLLVFALAFAVFAQGSSEKNDGPVTIKLSAADNTYGLSTDPELQGAITNLILEKTGVNVEPIIPPLASYNDKLATLINSGDAPDLFVVAQCMAKIPQYVARGQLLDLTDYIKNSEALKAIDPSLLAIPYTDGNNYFVPYNNPKSKGIMIRKDVMEKYGINLSATPTTEEFKREMSKLLGTGITPFTFPKWVDNFQFFYNSFGAWAGVYKNEAGVYVDGFQEPEVAEALKYIHELYTMGILNAEFITTENSQMREKTYTGQSASDIDYITNYINYVQNTEKAGCPTEMHVIYKLVGPNGDGGALNEATQTAFVISADTKHPDEAFKVLEAIVTDPELYPAFFGIGVEGAHYTLSNSGEITPTAKASNSGYKYTLNYLSDSFLNIQLDKLPFTLNESLLAGIKTTQEHIRAVVPNLGPNHNADVLVGLSEEYDRVSPSIKSTRESIAAKIVMGSVTVEEGMAEYQNFWKSINGPKILAELNGSK